ncbi:Shwachman-Bodian-Diamond syndrome like protein [Spraguea lophii 42_110]|uniref:Shwachman-Bodian-Diamond syndrome like protein n=1 Tax=Spraguea lophii (strain 42_110) TaxID=1358809 RepID=S7XQ27_SPRLO|nr:Shwachman-Bodian-Diamond syndrome like protein [Spraguea lophii 42_110]
MAIIFEKTKKLINVSIVTLKKYNKRYELAVIPNKLLLYRENKIELSEVLHTWTIFKDVSEGTICSKEDLALFYSNNNKNNNNSEKSDENDSGNMKSDKNTKDNINNINTNNNINNTNNINNADNKIFIIKQILKEGTLRITSFTRNILFKQKENEIINYLQKNILKDNKYITRDKIINIVSKYNITEKDSKIQAKEIIQQLEKEGYVQKHMKLKVYNRNYNKSGRKSNNSKSNIKVNINNKDINNNTNTINNNTNNIIICRSKEYGEVIEYNDYFIIKLHPKNFKKYIQLLNNIEIKYNILPSDEVEEEEIC